MSFWNRAHLFVPWRISAAWTCLRRWFLLHIQSLSARIYTSSQIPFFIFSVSEWQFQNPVTDALLLRSQKLQPQNIHKDKIMETPQLKEKWNSLSACPHLPHTFENQLACQHHGERSKPAFYQWGWKHLLPFYVRVPWNLEYNIKWAGALCNFQTSRGGLTPLLIAKNSV